MICFIADRSLLCGKLLFESAEISLLLSGLYSFLKTLSDWECVGVDNSDTKGVDSSSLSPAADVAEVVPIKRSFNLDNFSKLACGTEIGIADVDIVGTVSSLSVDTERLFFDEYKEDVGFKGILFPT